MRAALIVSSCLIAACATAGNPPVAAPPVTAPPVAAPASTADAILSAGLESRYVLDSGDGEAWLGIRITPQATGIQPPVALALVVDTSGSMAGHKIEHARFAARSIVDRLRPTDQLTIVRFSSDVQTLLPRTRMADANRSALLTLVDGFDASGRTALHGGMVAGMNALTGSGDAVRRVVLLSDGQANVGPTQADQIIAGLPAAERPTTLSAIGVGSDYDAAVMTAVATHGNGGFYHLTDPIQLAGILEEELARAHAVAGTAAVLTLHPEPGVEVIGSPGLVLHRQADGSVQVQVGEVYGGEARTVSVKIKVPASGPQQGVFGRVALRYQPVGQADAITRTQTVRFARTPKAEQVAAGEVPVFMVAADRMRVAHVLTDAAALLKEGDLLEAQAVLRDERARLQARRARLSGAAQTEADGLIAMFQDPIVDAKLGVQAVAKPNQFDALVKRIRGGKPIASDALAGLAKDRLRILRNVAYARHGYRFKSGDLQAWFAQRSWYTADASFRQERLTHADVRAVTLIKTWEKRAGLSTVATPKRRGDLKAPMQAALAGNPLRDGQLIGLTLGQLRLLRNTAYARHGYTFRARDLRTHFGALAWYRADAHFDPIDLTPIDAANVQRIKARERALLVGAKDSVRELELRSRSRARQAVR